MMGMGRGGRTYKVLIVDLLESLKSTNRYCGNCCRFYDGTPLRIEIPARFWDQGA